MKAKLVSYSQPDKDTVFTEWTPNDLIAYAARVSNPSNQNNRCLLYTSPSPRDKSSSRMPSSA